MKKITLLMLIVFTMSIQAQNKFSVTIEQKKYLVLGIYVVISNLRL